MLHNRYSNFVRSSPEGSFKAVLPSISGKEARRLYLEEIEETYNIPNNRCTRPGSPKRHTKKVVNIVDNIPNKDLFIYVQNDDVQTVTSILNSYPDKLNTKDEFGWSLLMIACQANSVETVKELLKRNVDISVRDKAGNSARSLVIKNRNLTLADILLGYKDQEASIETKSKKTKKRLKECYKCDICNKEFPDKEEHLSSTVHNISASKGKQIPTNYVIPETNRGFQIMLRVGWDKESGLGPDGSGNKYPIKTVQKQDRRGLGLDKKRRKQEENKNSVKCVSKKMLERDNGNNRSMEINFRRQFY